MEFIRTVGPVIQNGGSTLGWPLLLALTAALAMVRWTFAVANFKRGGDLIGLDLDEAAPLALVGLPGAHASTVRPDPSTQGVVGERGSHHESCSQLGSGR
jgi:hypothetical protein